MNFIFDTTPRDHDPEVHNWAAYETKKDQKEGRRLCRGIERIGDAYSYATLEDDGRAITSNRNFANKEEAARSVYEVREALKKCPVPVDTQQMIERMVEDVRRDCRELQSVQTSLHFRKRDLFYHAKRLGIPTFLEEDDVDPTIAFRKLLQWVPEFGLPVEQLVAAGKKSGMTFDAECVKLAGQDQVPFLSQAVIYALLGKECARTFYALLRNAITVAGLQWEEIEHPNS